MELGRLIRRTVLSCTTHRGLSMQTLASIQGCPFAGVSLTQGITDVALARCLQVKAALQSAEHYNAAFVLMVDDDMVFSAENVAQVLEECERLAHPVSARYMTGDLQKPALACSALGNGRFMTGLGFLAIPVEHLKKRVGLAKVAKWGEQEIPVITACGAAGTVEGMVWVSEDYELTVGLGGVYLSAVEVGHIKPVTLLPSQFKLEPPEPPRPRAAPATSEASEGAPAVAPSAPSDPSAPADNAGAPLPAEQTR